MFQKIILAFLVFASSHASAAIMHPSILNPDDQYRYAFVTSTTRNASSANIADYDAHVTAAIVAEFGMVDLGAVTWRAWGSTDTVNAIDHLQDTSGGWDDADTQIFLINTDTVIADNFMDLTDASLDAAINRFETGMTDVTVQVWTGTSHNGLKNPSGQTRLGKSGPLYGDSERTDSFWTSRTFDFSGDRHFYGFSDVITVSGGPTVPEPSSLALLALASIGLGVRCLRKRN